MPCISKLLSVVIIVVLNSLAGQSQTKDAYHQLVYNGKNCNQLIIDRLPDYGISGRDGCIVGREIVLELKDIDTQQVEGWIKDAETGEALVGASIKLQRKNGSNETLKTDSYGRFLMNKSSPLKKLNVEYLGYRILKIKGSSKELF